MTDVSLQTEKLSIGKVIRESFAVLGRNLATFVILGIVLVGLPSAVVGFFQFEMIRDALDNGAIGGNLTQFYGVLAYMIFTLILQATLVYATVADLSGRRAAVGEALATGLRSFLPLLAVTILIVLGVGFGMLLLIVPGVMIALAWCVATPALVVERRGILGSLSRSAELTRRNRWRLLGLFALIVLASWVIGLVVGAVGLLVSAITGGVENVLLMNSLVFSPLSNSVSAIVSATLISTVYVELRRLKEGADPTQLAAVFD